MHINKCLKMQQFPELNELGKTMEKGSKYLSVWNL
jgi:hypothetical protein